MKTVSLTIDGRDVTAPEGATVLEAAESAGIQIPTLCHLKDIDPRANCRMCLVEIERRRVPQPSCATFVEEGMVVTTQSEALDRDRKMNLELILANHAVDCHHCMRIGSSSEASMDPKFCEMCFWCDCERDGFCELQSLARRYGVDLLEYSQRGYDHPIDDSTAVVRNPNKCIKCRRCINVCNSVQTVHNLCAVDRGTDTKVVPSMDKPMKDSPCVRCGRCAEACPTGAIHMREHIDEALYYAHAYGFKTAAIVPETDLPELDSLFDSDNKIGQRTLRLDGARKIDPRNVASYYKKIGVDKVFGDAAFKAASVEEGARMLEQAVKGSAGGTVVITSSPAAVNFVKANYPALAKNLVVYRSAMEVFNDYAKGELATSAGIKPTAVKTFVLTTANEDQAAAEESGGVDLPMNAREFFRMALRSGGNLNTNIPVELDDPGLIAREIANAGFFATQAFKKKGAPAVMEVSIDGMALSAAVAVNLGQARALLDELVEGRSEYAVIRLQA